MSRRGDRHTVRPTHRQRKAAARRRRNRKHDGKPSRRARRIAARESMVRALFDVPSMGGGRR